ncbi:hypothetical protein KHA94_20080 [Bacillus sp. FJAT-49705]|uniref:ATPase BadF/BadG/BcrA/BcrD type domain-containing protein n=1 Tax=Cytobacillus citreus TaxID=2833586 RepID=A0ABS5NYK2_9BACI|nr:BadF/BadG/BcrA/BcrD ATPase family protein [Cytobacillus citreus]MBS4192458.1 hypothetical protein [Cytobacillus citreus]
MYVLGIDGGGTKTKGVLCDYDGRIHIEATVGPTNINSLGYEKVEKEIKCLLTELQLQEPDKFAGLTSLFAGMSGVDREEDKVKMMELYQKYLPVGCQIMVDNDAVNALYSGTQGKPGVVNISGTGAITFGINESNIRTRAGGWGFMLDDPGSGFSIGKRALKAMFDEYDGFGKNTILTPAILSAWNMAEVPELISVIYDFNKSREKIASLSKMVVKAAEDGDEIAKEILLQAGIEMGMNIRRLILKLFKDDQSKKEIPIVLVGGIYNNADWFLPVIEKSLNFEYLKTTIILPDLPPVAGSVIAAILAQGVNIGENFESNFQK